LVDAFGLLLPHLNERQQRLTLGAAARVLGHGGIRMVAGAAGVAESTVSRGKRELEHAEEPAGRVRAPGAGRKPLRETDSGLVPALLALVEPDQRGDPESPLLWTVKSTRNLAAELTRQGHLVGSDTVAALLKAEGFSLQGTSRTTEGARHPDRDAQFRYINDQVTGYLVEGQPVISVDAKKKETLGDYAVIGREWHRAGQPVQVRAHDFPEKGARKAVPYGIYDIGADAGWVSVGCDGDTSAFAVATLRRWWNGEGRRRYPHASRLLVTADAGGSNGYRVRAWKKELADFAYETGLEVTVCHFPPGTSNRVGDWRGDAVRAFRFQPPPPRFRACGSPAHGSPTPFTTGIRLPPPVPEGPGGDDVPRKTDQTQMVRGGIRHHVPSKATGAFVAFADEQRHPHPHVLPDHTEAVG